MKVIQYTPWIECSTNCRFCTNRGQPDINHVQSLIKIIDLLDDSEVNDYDGIGLIGGEFFQHQLDNPVVCDLFYELTDKLIEKNKAQYWIATCLIYKPKCLMNWLSYTTDIHDRLLLCTSYDVYARFNRNSHALWESNMLLLHTTYPQLKIHTEMIVTEALMQQALAGEFNFTEFANKWNTTIDFIEPHTGFQNIESFKCDLPLFLPKRSTFLRFLNEIVSTWDSVRIDKFLNPYIRSATIYHIQNGELVKIEDRYNKRMEQQALNIKPVVGYADSDKSMIDDVLAWKESR